MRILLARHAETEWNVLGRHQGRSFDVPLSAVGRGQAQALGERLRDLPISAAVSSPLLRAQQTAELVLGSRASLLSLDPDLEEISHGEWEGCTAEEIRVGWPELQLAWRERPDETRPPGGESLAEVQARGWAALGRASRGLGPEDLLLVMAHDGVNRLLLCRILGLPLSRVWSFRQAPTTLNLLEGDALDRLGLVRLNDVSHLFPLFGESVHRKV